jgi:SAM-dependent methyltransferase
LPPFAVITATTDRQELGVSFTKRLLQHVLKHSPALYRVASKAYALRTLRLRVFDSSTQRLTNLCTKALHPDSLELTKTAAAYNDIIDDLIAYTGFSAEELVPRLRRDPEYHFESEFEWYKPQSETELTWFYRCSSDYLFGNATHAYNPKLDIITQGKVLDYGAGVGSNTIGLAKRGIEVDFLEVSCLQSDFINFRANRHNLKNIRQVLPYHNGRFDPVLCIREQYDAIVAMDVFEHIPNYHIVVAHLIRRLNPGGIIIEQSPFEPSADDIAIHLRPSLPLEEAMVGMQRIDKGIWKKKS